MEISMIIKQTLKRMGCLRMDLTIGYPSTLMILYFTTGVNYAFFVTVFGSGASLTAMKGGKEKYRQLFLGEGVRFILDKYR